MPANLNQNRASLVYPSRRVLLGTRNKDNNDISVTSKAYDDMWVDWELIEDLCVGRDEMIRKERRWLPQEPKEEYNSYRVRLDRTFLFGAFKDTIERLSAKPFSREVTIKNAEKIPERLRPIEKNVDLLGTDITAFSKKIFKDGIKYGHSLVLVDFPEVGPDLTLAEELELGIRPYFIHISPPNLIGWRSTKVRGTEVLTEIRYVEKRVVPDGPFGDKEIEVIRHFKAPLSITGQEDADSDTKGTITEWVRESGSEQAEWKQGKTTTHTYPGIPLVWLPLNPSCNGLLRSTPPLQELAEANLEHWQKSSDKSNILRFVSIAMVLLSGVEQAPAAPGDEQATGGPDTVAWGVNQILTGPKGADGKYIEHSGAGVNSLAQHLKELEAHMETLGLQPLMARQADVTAAAQHKDDAKITSGIQSWIRVLERMLRELWTVASRWTGDEIPWADEDVEDGVAFDVFNEFGLKVATRDDADQLLKARMAGEISQELFLSEWKKRGLIGEEVDIEDELQKSAQEAELAAERAAEIAGAQDEDEDEEDEEDEDQEDDAQET